MRSPPARMTERPVLRTLMVLRLVDHRVRDGVEKARLTRRQHLAVAATLFRVADVEFALGARDPT
jgi:hypothetical protein